MTIDEMIAVLQAAKEGKAIEVHSRSMPNWEVTETPVWNFVECEYRVKPEPRRWWHCVNDKDASYTSCASREIADAAVKARAHDGRKWRVVEVVEVL